MTNLLISVTLWVNLITNPVPVSHETLTNGGSVDTYVVQQVSSIQQYLTNGALLDWRSYTHHSYLYKTNSTATGRTGQVIGPFSGPLPTTPPDELQPPGVILPWARPEKSLRLAATLTNHMDNTSSNYCPMLLSQFKSERDTIYLLEGSPDLEHWIALEPEIDGTGAWDWFADPVIVGQTRFYRVKTRPGTLPP